MGKFIVETPTGVLVYLGLIILVTFVICIWTVRIFNRAKI